MTSEQIIGCSIDKIPACLATFLPTYRFPIFPCRCCANLNVAKTGGVDNLRKRDCRIRGRELPRDASKPPAESPKNVTLPPSSGLEMAFDFPINPKSRDAEIKYENIDMQMFAKIL